MLPFERYLQDPSVSSYDNTQGALDVGPTAFSNKVQLQIPHFMYTGPPTLAPGGGAEVLSVGTFNHNDALAASWFTNNNGFSPDEAYLSSSLRSCTSQLSYGNVDEQHSAHPNLDIHHYDLTGSTLISEPSPLQPPPPQAMNHDDDVRSQTREDQPSMTEHSLTFGEPTRLPAPSPLAYPVYSATGFDVLSILARVASRSNPRVVLGPVDLTCSFVIVDVRRHDHPIVYCSPSFCRLTGYNEAEVLGRNCRFLQSPDGRVQKGEQRHFTSPEAVAHLKKNLLADKECQTSIINYRKGGSAFINLVTVIPISGGVSALPHEENDIVYHVGFQVDLTEQPNYILQKLRDGSHMVNYTQTRFSSPNDSLLGGSVLGATGGAKKAQIVQPLISKELKKLLAHTDFVRSIPISSSTTVPPLTTSSADKGDSTDSNQWLSLMLLETCPDFVHVVSLKGSFLYVAPSVRRVLGYEPEEMVGGSIADFSHPEDIVPLMRELKESSSTGGASSSVSSLPQDGPQSAQVSITPRTVDLLFRARTKTGAYVWVECRGRLHVEPGKGRKAIILSGRAREMPGLKWDVVHQAGGLARSAKSDKDKRQEQEFWSMLAGQGTFVVVGSAVKAVLGWDSADLVGHYIGSLLSCDDTSGLQDEVKRMRWGGGFQEPVNNEGKPQEKSDFGDFVRLRCRLRRANGGSVNAMVVLYRPMRDALVDASPMPAQSISPSHIICQIKLDDSLHIGSGDGGGGTSAGSLSPSDSSLSLGASVHQPGANVFDELETSRNSSWQYELQQLKFANQRLEDEVCLWEARLTQRQSREPSQVVDMGETQARDGDSEQLQHQVQQSLYVSSSQPALHGSVQVYPSDQTQVPSPTAAHVSCHLSPQTFALLTQAQAPVSPQHSDGPTQQHPPYAIPAQVPAVSVYTINTVQDTDFHETCIDHHRNQPRYPHSHQTFHSHYSPFPYHVQQQQHHQRQQSYPPSTCAGHQMPPPYSSYSHSHSQTRLKRSWDSAQYS